MKNCPILNISLVSRFKSAIMLYETFNFKVIWLLNVFKSQSRSFKVIRTSIFRISPCEMKIFKKIKINKTWISRNFLQVIDPKEADFRITFFVKHHLGGGRGQIGSKFTFNGISGGQKNLIIKFLRDHPDNFIFLSN